MDQELTEKVSQYKARRAKGEKPIVLWVKPHFHKQLKLAAESMGEPVTAWSIRALAGALNRWKKPQLDKSLYPRCNMCGTRHDPKDHFSDEEE